MAVEDFLKIEDVKQTVEKKVKQKPSLAERTTIEFPGKLTSTKILEQLEPKKVSRRRKKQPKVIPSNITRPKTNTTLIITEKPQAAQKIASAIGNSKKITVGRASYFEAINGDKTILIGSAVGHLFNLAHKDKQKGWPIFDIEWRPSYEKKNGAFTKIYYSLLKNLSKRASEYVIATDYDIEGEVIGWNILRFICNQKTAKRMRYSTLTKSELKNSYDNLDSTLNWGNAYAGETRHMLDWFYGINLSRALMSAIKITGSFKLLSIGRVQGPALKIIVEREREIASFIPETYWQVLAKIGDYFFKHPTNIFDKKELEKFNSIKSGIAKTKSYTQNISPPTPFDLTTLQREAYRVHKITPSQLLKTAQKIYLDGLISYPRTSSQKIPKQINPKSILKKLAKNFPEAKFATRSSPVEGKKSDPAHPSIYPTGEFKPLFGLEKKVYDLIAKRFISAFSQDALTDNKKVTVISDTDLEIIFINSGLTIKEAGWTKIYPSTLKDESCPTLNGKVEIEKLDFKELKTKSPNRYTPTSLITTLEKKNLGTKATRSSIIDILFDRGYLGGKSIQATKLGIKLIESLEKYSPIILDENLTRTIENEMEKIQLSKTNLKEMEKQTLEKAKRLLIDISKGFKSQELNIGKEILKGMIVERDREKEDSKIGSCPSCNQGNLRILYSKKYKRQFIGCSNYPKCNQTYSLPPNYIKKLGTDCPFCKFPKLVSLKKGRKPWEFCFNKECTSNKERLEKWKSKQNNQVDSSTK